MDDAAWARGERILRALEPVPLNQLNPTLLELRCVLRCLQQGFGHGPAQAYEMAIVEALLHQRGIQ